MMQMTGADLIVKLLERQGISTIAGVPGGAALPMYDALSKSETIHHVLCRHEQGAGHMAEGYAHATGRPGVAMVTSGPGATNIVTPLADAYMDRDEIALILKLEPSWTKFDCSTTPSFSVISP